MLRPATGRTSQRRDNLATIIAYHRFCCENSRYHHTMANQLHIFRWLDERRIEMVAEGRPHWVPSEWDFWQAMRDCCDDLVKPEVRSSKVTPTTREFAHSIDS